MKNYYSTKTKKISRLLGINVFIFLFLINLQISNAVAFEEVKPVVGEKGVEAESVEASVVEEKAIKVGESENSIETELSTKLDAPTDTFVIADVKGDNQLLSETLIAHGLVSEEGKWLGTSELVLIGQTTSEDLKSTLETLKNLKDWQAQAEDTNAPLSIILGKPDIEWGLTFSANEEESENLVAWFLQQEYLLKKGTNIFSYGGISSEVNKRKIESLNRNLKKHFAKYRQLKNRLESTHNIILGTSRHAQVANVTKLPDSEDKAAFLKSNRSAVFTNYWPTNYTGNAFCHPAFEKDNVTSFLSSEGAERLWNAHGYLASDFFQSRFNGSAILFPKANLDEERKLWIAKLSNNEKIDWYYGTEIQPKQVELSPTRHYKLPYSMSVSEIENFLKTASITSKDETKEGRTKPIKLKLEKDGKTMKAIFKYVNDSGRKSRNKVPRTGDRFRHEMAAYKLDRMLGLELVPIAVERAILGKNGVVQLWIDGLVSAIPLNTQEITYDGVCDVSQQENMMNTFDYLVMNFDRNQSNITFTKADWQIWFIDHTRAFGTQVKLPPFLKEVKVSATNDFKERLKRLERKSLDELLPWLKSRQIDAIWKRREILLSSEFVPE